jgi:hypothetical protein
MAGTWDALGVGVGVSSSRSLSPSVIAKRNPLLYIGRSVAITSPNKEGL